MKKLIYGILLILAVAAAYEVGWWRSVRYQAVAGAIASGNIYWAVLSALEKGDQQGALGLLETSIRSSVITLNGFKNNIPKPFIQSAKIFLSRTSGVNGLDPSVGEGPRRMPWGTRTYTLTLPKASSSIIKPGQYVDISVTFGSKALRSTASVVNHVFLVKEKDSCVYTLVVTPEQALMIDRALKKDYATVAIQKTTSEPLK